MRGLGNSGSVETRSSSSKPIFLSKSKQRRKAASLKKQRLAQLKQFFSDSTSPTHFEADPEMDQVLSEVDQLINADLRQGIRSKPPQRKSPVRLPKAPMEKTTSVRKLSPPRPTQTKRYFVRHHMSRDDVNSFELVRKFNRRQPTRQRQLDTFNRPTRDSPPRIEAGLDVYYQELNKLRRINQTFLSADWRRSGSSQAFRRVESRKQQRRMQPDSSLPALTALPRLPAIRLASRKDPFKVKLIREIRQWSHSLERRNMRTKQLTDVISKRKSMN